MFMERRTETGLLFYCRFSHYALSLVVYRIAFVLNDAHIIKFSYCSTIIGK